MAVTVDDEQTPTDTPLLGLTYLAHLNALTLLEKSHADRKGCCWVSTASNLTFSAAGESAEAPSSKRDKHDVMSSADEAIAAANATLAATDPTSLPESGGEGTPSKASPGGTVGMDTKEEEQQAAERRESHAAAASRGTGDGLFKEAEGSMREYRNDLEYLEDSFKLMIILLR